MDTAWLTEQQGNKQVKNSVTVSTDHTGGHNTDI